MQSTSRLLAIATLLVGLNTNARATLLVHEPFAYTAGQSLQGQGGGTGFAAGALWTAANSSAGLYPTPRGFAIVSSGTLWSGIATSVPHTGNYAGSPVAAIIGGSPNGNDPDHLWASRLLNSTVTGSFIAGNTTWISYMMASNFANNTNFTGAMLALGQGTVTNRGNVVSGGPAVGIGIFTSGGVFRNGSATPPSGPVFFGATVWDSSIYTSSLIPLHQVPSAQEFTPNTVGFQYQAYVCVAKIVWNETGGSIYATAFPDGTTLTEAAFDAAAAYQSFTANPAMFNKISFAGGRYDVDELRLATTFGEAVGWVADGPPTITSITPDSGWTGDLVVITGTNFAGTTEVSFNGIPASSYTVDPPTQITAMIPEGVSSGKISVTNDYGTGQSGTDFTAVNPFLPTITSFTPTTWDGGMVMITGTNLWNVQSVSFNGVESTAIYQYSDTEIWVEVPFGATTGKIAVTTFLGTTESATNFIIPPPTITSFTPVSGWIGASVVISGTFFGSVSAVTFNGTAATTYTVDSDTQITAVVPAGATSGRIAVTSANGTALSATDLIIAAGTPHISLSMSTGPDLGIFYPGQEPFFVLGIHNDGEIDITGLRVEVSVGGGWHSDLPLVLKPGESTGCTVIIGSGPYGPFGGFVNVLCDQQAGVQLPFSGYYAPAQPLPRVFCSGPNNLTPTSASFSASYVGEGYGAAFHCSVPTSQESWSPGMDGGSGWCVFTNLTPDTWYSVFADVYNAGGTGYSDTITFRTPLAVPEITILQLSENLTDGGSNVGFGSVNVGANTSLAFTIRNDGYSDLTGLAVSKDGTDAGDFILGTLGATTLAAKTSTTFTVTFAPIATGPRTATIHIASNDADENPFDINLTGGSGETTIAEAIDQPGIDVTMGGSGPSWIPWGWGHDEVDSAVTGNMYPGATSSFSIWVAGPCTASFWWYANLFDTIGMMPIAMLEFTVEGGRLISYPLYNPSWIQETVILGAGNHKLTWSFNQFAEGMAGVGAAVDQVVLSGVGGVADIAVEQADGTNLSDGSASANFGSVGVESNIVKIFTVKNLGTADLTGIDVEIDGPNGEEFTVGTPGVTTLAAGGSTTFEVNFAPATAGAKTAALHIASNDADENPFDITLTGTGYIPAPKIDVSNYSDGSQVSFHTALGSSEVQTFTVHNGGSADLNGLAVSKDGTDAADFSIGTLGATTLAPGTSTTFSVTFTPTSIGVRNAALHIASNDTDENPYDLSLLGNYNLAEAIDQPGVAIVNDGSMPWVPTSWVPYTDWGWDTHDGVDAARSGIIGMPAPGGSSSFSTTVVGPGTVSFWWKAVTGYVFNDSWRELGSLSFSVDSSVQRSLTFTNNQGGWTQETVSLGVGSHLLTWTHEQWNNPEGVPGMIGGAWVDQVILPAGPTPRQMFDSWAATANLAGANADPLATPHHDGVVNLLKYAFRMSGNAPDVEVLAPGVGTVGLPSITLDRSGAPGMLRFEYLRRKNSGLSYIPRKSHDLVSWSPLTATPAVQAILSNPEWERVIVAEPIDSVTEPQCFGRVEVVLPAP